MYSHRMTGSNQSFSRRDFLKLTALGAGALAFRPFSSLILPDFPEADMLGRVTVGKVDVFSRPDANSPIVGALYEDNVVAWIRESVGSMPGRTNQRFVETPNGFIWGGQVQPVQLAVPAKALNRQLHQGLGNAKDGFRANLMVFKLLDSLKSGKPEEINLGRYC